MDEEKRAGQKEAIDTEESASDPAKKSWEEPKLAFVEPELTRHGDLEKVTRGRGKNGFFGAFSP